VFQFFCVFSLRLCVCCCDFAHISTNL